MPKTKNMYGVAYEPIHKSQNKHKHGNAPSTKSPIRSGLVNFLFFLISICLSVLVVPVNVWAVPKITMSVVDSKGNDSVFNGSSEQLRITINLTAPNRDPIGPYMYELTANGRQIPGGSGQMNKDESKTLDWNAQDFSEGSYTIQVKITQEGVVFDPPLTAERTATLDKTAPKISIGTGKAEFSPNRDQILDTLSVYYSMNEDVAESQLEFVLNTGAGGTPFGQPVRLSGRGGNHTYTWNGGVGGSRIFPDGQYVLRFRVVDKGGNAAALESTPVTIDTEPPIISQVVANENLPLVDGSFTSASIQLIKVTANAAGGTPLDFISNQTEITLSEQRGVTVAGNLNYDASALTFTLGNHLDTVFENGEYTVSITLADRAGNTAEKTLNFTFDNASPTLSGVATSSGELTPDSGIRGEIDFVEAVLTDNVQGSLNLSSSTIRLTGPSGAILGQQTQPDANTIRWIFLSPLLAKDGLMDGGYTIEVVGIDKAGNQTGTLQIPFIYDNLAPRVTLGSAPESPFTLIQDTIYHTQPFSQIVATFDDAGGVGIDLQESTRILFGTIEAGAQFSPLPGREFLAKERDQLTYILETPLASRDGSQDGRYGLDVQATDTLGNTETYNYYFIYDTQLPTLVSTTPAANETVSNLSQVEVVLEEMTSGIDFVQSTFRLTRNVGATPVEVPVNIKSNGIDTATLTLAQPIALDGSDDGTYTIEVTPSDLAGNFGVPVRREFYLVSQSQLPIVTSVLIDGKLGTIVYVNGDAANIVATFADLSGDGLDLDDGGSSITVTTEGGIPIPSITTSNGTNQLTWTPTVLPTDGSADGRYTVVVTPKDKIGRQGDVIFRQFVYDTQEPRITASTPVALNQPATYIRDLTQFQFTVEDVGPAGLELEEQNVELLDFNDTPIDASLTFDEINSRLYLTLDTPLVQDGSADGEYTVKVSLVDKSGNVSDSEQTFIYDSQAPRLSAVSISPEMELVPQQIIEISESISSITLQFEEATRVDFTNTVVALVGPGERPIPLNISSDGVTQLTARFVELTQAGLYTLSVTPQDIAGNTPQGAVQYSFRLEFILPSVSTVELGGQTGDVVFLNGSDSSIVATLVDAAGTGLELGEGGSNIVVTSESGAVVPGQTRVNGLDQLIWEPISIPTDGSADGRYTVAITPVDKVGRQGDVVYRRFIYDTQEPEIVAAAPIDLSQPFSYISQSLTQFSFTVADVGPADLELSDQRVSLRDTSGNLVPSQLTNDTDSQLFLTLDRPLPLDGSMDGEYTIVIQLADKAGNTFTVEHPIIYDTQAPALVSTVPADGALLTEDITQIQVTLNDEGGSGIDWAMTTVTLLNPSEQQISGELVSNGATELTLSTNQLVEDGRYIIRVRAVDRAGNGNANLFQRSFLLSRSLPVIVSTEPVTAPEDEAFTNEEIEQIEVSLETDDENHLSTLRLLNPANQIVAGQQERARGRLIYNLGRPLATDGSEDGLYTIEFTPISASGRSGEIQQLTFMYDTQAPEIESDDAISFVVTQPGVNNSLTEIRVNLTDDSSGIDWENLDEEWLTFERLSPNPAEIAGRVSDDGQGNLTFRFTVPLADNGSADGEYQITVNPKDQAGNDDKPYERVFIYDTSPPRIDASTLLVNDTPLVVDINAEDYPTALSTADVVIQVSIFDTGLGVDLAQSRITVRGPDGSEVSGSAQQNGVDTIVFKSDGLTVQGHYQITVTSVGNDSELLGFAPTDSITAQFLYETEVPTATVTSDGGETELTDEPLPLEGTATDPEGEQRVGEGQIPIPASGVWLVEIVGTGPDNQPIDPVPAVDDSNVQEEPWSRWSIDFLPTRSGEYDLDVRVTDNAGNYAVYDIGTYTMSVSLTFRGSTFGWPNPLRLSKRDVAFFSFDVNVPLGETVELTLSIYDWSGDMVLSQTYPDVVSGQRSDQLVKWNLENQAGTPVARGLYIFRLEAVNAAGNSAHAVGKVLVVD